MDSLKKYLMLQECYNYRQFEALKESIQAGDKNFYIIEGNLLNRYGEVIEISPIIYRNLGNNMLYIAYGRLYFIKTNVNRFNKFLKSYKNIVSNITIEKYVKRFNVKRFKITDLEKFVDTFQDAKNRLILRDVTTVKKFQTYYDSYEIKKEKEEGKRKLEDRYKELHSRIYADAFYKITSSPFYKRYRNEFKEPLKMMKCELKNKAVEMMQDYFKNEL